MNDSCYAHTLSGCPEEEWQDLRRHLESVSGRAADSGPWFGASDWTRVAGLWHDLGKYSDAFQDYLRAGSSADPHMADTAARTDHSTAGAQHAVAEIDVVGHHSGLLDALGAGACLEARLTKVVEPWSRAPDDLLAPPDLRLPDSVEAALRPGHRDPFSIGFFVRMVFSCLVDADFLDTEGFMDPERARDPSISPPTLAGMVAMRLLLALLVSLAAVVPVSARAQDPETAPPFVAGGHLLFATPTGPFAENVDFGFGLGGHGRYVVDDGGILSLRLDLGFINYGNETIRICVILPCRVTGDLTTDNNIFLLGIGPEIGGGSGSIRMYANASIGFAHFSTTSSVNGSNDVGNPFASSTNFQDATFAWTAGPGLQLRVWTDEQTSVSLDVFARYNGNGEARYLRKGDIQDQPDGSVLLNPRKSETNFWTIGLGVSARWR